MNNNAPQDELITAMSPSIFVLSCIGLAIAHGVSPENFGDYSHIVGTLFSQAWVFWIAIAVSLFIVLSFGFPSIKKQCVALAIGVIGTLFILASAAFELSWLVCMVFLFAVLVPASGIAFSQVTKGKNK